MTEIVVKHNGQRYRRISYVNQKGIWWDEHGDIARDGEVIEKMYQRLIKSENGTR